MAVFLARMVMPRSRSNSLESITRSTWVSLARKVPLWFSMASTSVVFPWSTCAIMAMLRILFLLKTNVLPGWGKPRATRQTEGFGTDSLSLQYAAKNGFHPCPEGLFLLELQDFRRTFRFGLLPFKIAIPFARLRELDAHSHADRSVDLSITSCCYGLGADRQCAARILIHSLNFTRRFFRRPDFLAVSARHQGHEAAEGDPCARSEVSRSASRCRAARDGRHAGGRQCQRACRGGPRASQRRTCLRDERSEHGEEMEVPSGREEWTGRTGAGDGGDEVREVAENSCQ